MARKSRVPAAISALMAEGGRHAWTLDELHGDLGSRGIAADFSSVFRAAERLVADGILRKLALDDGRARFELRGAHHDHLHCTRCDRLVPLSCVVDRTLLARVEATTGFAIAEHCITLSGTCERCQAAEPRR